MDIEQIKQYIYCPISHQIFKLPIIIESGITYEKECIEEWLKENNTCPITKKDIYDGYFNINILIKNLVSDFLTKYPEYQEEQYKIDLDYDKINLGDNDYLNDYINTYTIININFNKLKKNIFKNEKIIKLIINNLNEYNNLECEDNENWRPIHFICKYSTENIINKILDIYIEKNLNLECENNEKFRPIHFICLYSTEKMINKILNIYVEKNLNLECEDNEKWKPIHYICKNSTENMINKILDIYIEKNLNLECENNEKFRPIHFICSHSTEKMINKILDIYIEKNLNLECKNNNNWKPIHFICRHSTEKMINKIITLTK
jgi:hypothetical protein